MLMANERSRGPMLMAGDIPGIVLLGRQAPCGSAALVDGSGGRAVRCGGRGVDVVVLEGIDLHWIIECLVAAASG